MSIGDTNTVKLESRRSQNGAVLMNVSSAACMKNSTPLPVFVIGLAVANLRHTGDIESLSDSASAVAGVVHGGGAGGGGSGSRSSNTRSQPPTTSKATSHRISVIVLARRRRQKPVERHGPAMLPTLFPPSTLRRR